ncbi:PTR3 [Candida theae]|uniref:PTR3 n=1 Tax=Candida theae TaxID=1198502 RepID=A0AAD5G0R1_9ASCO|nr:PTR3 [Candida theae]KAI5967048.1 PTR3 [Candida theae]
MDQSSLDNLLRFPGYGQTVVSDASMLSCGCLTSESLFSEECGNSCFNCHATNVSIVGQIEPLRRLYHLIYTKGYRRPSHGERSRRSITRRGSKGDDHSAQQTSKLTESMNLMTLFHKFAKEEQSSLLQTESDSTVAPMDIVGKSKLAEDSSSALQGTPSSRSVSVSPQNFRQHGSDFMVPNQQRGDTDFETLLKHVSEQKEYNFSKCFPFHRKVLSFPVSQMKLNLGTVNPFKLGSFIKRSINSSIHTYIDFHEGLEITRFVLLSEKKWELYEYKSPSSETNVSYIKPVLVCCGKSTGEYGESQSSLRPVNTPDDHETIKSNNFDFNGKAGNHSFKDDLKKRLSSWDHTYCRLTKNYLVISGTRGIMRVFNINSDSKYRIGEPVYTYLTNFPIRCIAISPNENLIACSITGRERISNKEQPFVVLHRMSMSDELWVNFADPMLITVPFRDPIKLVKFNAASSHIICATVWESRYIIIKLRDGEKGYQKPRLVWSDSPFKSGSRQDDGGHANLSREEEIDDELMMASEGITDIQFGNMHSNTIVITSNTIGHRPPILIGLHGTQIDSSRTDPNTDGYSIENSFSSHHKDDEDDDYSMLKSSEVLLRFPEVGSSIHVAALSPRGDGIVFADKDGRLYLVSTPNINTQSGTGQLAKKTVVLLGDVASAERFTEAASVQFSADGGKVFTVDRKGLFQAFDFTKGIPGEDSDVVKCKIISM